MRGKAKIKDVLCGIRPAVEMLEVYAAQKSERHDDERKELGTSTTYNMYICVSDSFVEGR